MSMNDPNYIEAAWSEQERKLYKRAKEVEQGTSLSDPELASQLVALTDQVWQRAHHPTIKNMRKAAELTRLVRLLRSPRLFPEPSARVFELLLQIAKLSTQRPVASDAALSLLVLISRPGPRFEMMRRVDDLLVAPEQTLPSLALFVALKPQLGPGVLQAKIRQMDVQERCLRLVELLDVLKQDLELEAHELLVRLTFEALFYDLDADDRKLLVDRLIREITQQRPQGGRWSLVLSPLFEQNLQNASLQTRVLDIAFADEALAKAYWPLVLHYMRTSDVRLWPQRLWSWLEAHGQLEAVAILYPISQEKPGLFAPAWRRQSAAQAQRLVELISKREGHRHAFGALSVALQDDAGQLTLAGHQGALTLDDYPVEPMTFAPYRAPEVHAPNRLMLLWMWLLSFFRRR